MGIEEQLAAEQLKLISETHTMVVELNTKMGVVMKAIEPIATLQQTQVLHELRLKSVEDSANNHENRLKKIEHKGINALRWASVIIVTTILSGAFGRLVDIAFKALHLIKP